MSIIIVGLLLGNFVIVGVLNFHDAFPVRLIWLSSACSAIGGGSAVLLAIILSILTDATTESERSA